MLWKVISIIIDRHLVDSIKFHDILHMFGVHIGTGTATLEAKTLHKIAGIQQEFLYKIFVDLNKAYVALEQGRDLGILEGYGVGPRVYRILTHYWDWTTMAVGESR